MSKTAYVCTKNAKRKYNNSKVVSNAKRLFLKNILTRCQNDAIIHIVTRCQNKKQRSDTNAEGLPRTHKIKT